MTAAALGHDALLPRPPGGNGAGLLLALLVHGGLLLALTTVLDWRTGTTDVVSAELWASVPQIAAPQAETAPTPAPPPVPAPAPEPAPVRTPAPPPPPRVETKPAEPDIATARAERRKAEAEAEARKVAETERRKTEAESRKKAEEESRKKAEENSRRAAAEKERVEAAARKAEDERLARQREENLKRIMGQAGTATGTGGTGTAARSAAPTAAYAGMVTARIRPNIVYTGTLSDNPAAEVEVRTAPGGTIIARRLIKSSGHPDWDDAVMRAIDRTPSLPRDTDGRVPPTLIIAFRPRE